MLNHQNSKPQPPARVVIMGANGFVGGAIEARLAAADIPCLALGRDKVDLSLPEAAATLAKFLRPNDCFVAVSAQAPVKNLDMLQENLVIAHAMTEALKISPVAHVVNISSDAIYADSDAPLTESSCAQPGSYHGLMHLTRETMFLSEQTAPVCMIRPTLIYGVNDPHNGYGPNSFRRLAAEGKKIILFGEGEERRDHVHVDDVAELSFRCIMHRSIGALNVATGEVTSFSKIADMVVSHFDAPPPIEGSPRKGPLPHNGYRAFDSSASSESFLDFQYTMLPDGLAIVHKQMMETI